MNGLLTAFSMTAASVVVVTVCPVIWLTSFVVLLSSAVGAVLCCTSFVLNKERS